MIRVYRSTVVKKYEIFQDIMKIKIVFNTTHSLSLILSIVLAAMAISLAYYTYMTLKF